MINLNQKNELLKAYRMLFPACNITSWDSIQCLKPDEVKSAFRRRAFETHPDRARVLGKNQSDLLINFKEIKHAYERLHTYLKGRRRNEIYSRRRNFTMNSKNFKYAKTNYREFRGQHSSSNFIFKKNIPARELLIGQYLYYSGFISFKELFNAIIWQRSQRPIFGKIAKEWNILTPAEVCQVLRKKRYNEKFGECALRMGFINRFQYLAILGKQKISQLQFGQYFIKKGIFTEKQMDFMVKKMKTHNFNIRFKRKQFFGN